MYDYRSVRHVQLEITTKCNAACPQCPRNHHGGPTIKSLPITSWSLADLQRILPVDFVKQLDSVYFCGTYGDPMMNTEITDMCAWLRGVTPITCIVVKHDGQLLYAMPQRLYKLVELRTGILLCFSTTSTKLSLLSSYPSQWDLKSSTSKKPIDF